MHLATATFLTLPCLLALLPVFNDLPLWEGIDDQPISNSDKVLQGEFDAFAEATPVPSVPSVSPPRSTRATETGRPTSVETSRPTLTQTSGLGNPSSSRDTTLNAISGSSTSSERPLTSITSTGTRPPTRTITSSSGGVLAPSETPNTSSSEIPVIASTSIATTTDSQGNELEVYYEVTTSLSTFTSSGRVFTQHNTLYNTRTRTHTRTETETTSASASYTGYPLVMPSPLTHIPRGLCRRYPLLCVNAGMPPMPPRFLDNAWDPADDEF